MSVDFDHVEAAVLGALIAEGVQFVVIGGAAVQHYGMERSRDDLDLFVQPDPRNAKAIAAAMAALSPPLHLTPQHVDQLAGSKAQFRYLHVDFVTGIGGVSFDKAIMDAEETYSVAGRVRILSRAGLITTKLARSEDRDLVDVAFLRRSGV